MKKSKYHIFFWGLYIVYILILDIINLGPYFRLVKELIVFAIEIWIFYSFFYALRTFRKKQPSSILKTLLSLAVSMAVTVCLNYVRVLIGKYYGSVYYQNDTAFVIGSIEFYTQFAIYSLVYFYAQRSFERREQVQLLERKELEAEKSHLELRNNNIQLLQEKLQLEKELLLSENNFLRAQINPHFLYNSLNFFYSQTFEKQPEVAEGIIILSQIMRYSLSDFKNSNGLAWLPDEIEHIQNVIKIHQMRFEDNLHISFTIHGNATGRQVAPMVLVTLVENVFKHGNLQDKDHPAALTCTIHENEQSMIFTTCNKKKRGAKGNNTGVGLSNTLQRLQTLYKGKCSMEVDETEDEYRVALTMPFFEYARPNQVYNLSANYKA